MTSLVDYRLGLTESGRLAAKGPTDTLMQLLRVPGAQMHHDRGHEWLSMPATRMGVMCLEAMGSISKSSDEYLNRRRSLMTTSDDQMRRWLQYRPAMKRQLLDYQDDYCAWTLDKRGAVNASEQGTGKSIMTAALIGAYRQMKGITRVMICAPLDPLPQWETELYSSLPEEVCPLYIPMYDMPVPQRIELLRQLKVTGEFVAIGVNYEVLSKMKDELRRFKPHMAVFDESWKIKNPQAAMTKAALDIADECDLVQCLNGTLFSNDVGDAWSQVAAAAGRRYAGQYKDWVADYAEMIDVYVGGRVGSVKKPVGVKDPPGLMSRLEPVYWRATKATCLNLPEKLTPVKIPVVIDGPVYDLYELVKEEGEAGLVETIDFDGEWSDAFEEDENGEWTLRAEQAANASLAGAVTKILRLQQIASGFLPSVLTYKTPYSLPSWLSNMYDPETECYHFASAKEARLRRWIEDRMAGDPSLRLIIWSKFNCDVVRSARIAESVLGNEHVCRVMGGKGGIKAKDLQVAKDSFNSRDPRGIRVFSAQIKRMFNGHNLQGGDHNLMYSHTWSFLERDQLEDRTHRHGRDRAVAYWEFMATKPDGAPTIDHQIIAATEAKESMSARLARDTTAVLKGV